MRAPSRTLMVAWGDWVGRAATVLLALLAGWSVLQRWAPPESDQAAGLDVGALPVTVSVLTPATRIVAGALRVLARGGLLGMIIAMALGDVALQTNTLAQIRAFVALFAVPEAAAWCVVRAFAARASVADGLLVLAAGARRLELPLADVARVVPWRLPIPGPGLSLQLVSGERWPHGLALARPDALARALGGTPPAAPSPVARYAQARTASRRSPLDAPGFKFVLLPLALAIPAFRLHQHIAYGGGFGEYLSFGLRAYATTFALWWAAWFIAVVLCAAALRVVVETATLTGALVAPAHAATTRQAVERLALAALYLGLPAWLAVRMLAS